MISLEEVIVTVVKGDQGWVLKGRANRDSNGDVHLEDSVSEFFGDLEVGLSVELHAVIEVDEGSTPDITSGPSDNWEQGDSWCDHRIVDFHVGGESVPDDDVPYDLFKAVVSEINK